MALSPIIEFLLTLERPGGGRLLQSGASQYIVTIPPNTSIVVDLAPELDDWLQILYLVSFDPVMVPSAFYAYGSNMGVRSYEGIATQWWTNTTVDTYVIVSERSPTEALIQNLSNLNQYYHGNTHFLSIRSEEDYNEVRKALLIQNNMDATSLLNKMERALNGGTT
jgi:hypothetical protein